MHIDQQQNPSETLQELVIRVSGLLLQSSGLLSYQAKDLVHIMHFIRNLNNQKLQHYVLGKIHHQSKMPLYWHRKGYRTKNLRRSA